MFRYITLLSLFGASCSVMASAPSGQHPYTPHMRAPYLAALGPEVLFTPLSVTGNVEWMRLTAVAAAVPATPSAPAPAHVVLSPECASGAHVKRSVATASNKEKN